MLVKRNEILEWQERYKKLKYDLALTRRRVTMKLEECRKRFERQHDEIEHQREIDIIDLGKRYDDLLHQKKVQEK